MSELSIKEVAFYARKATEFFKRVSIFDMVHSTQDETKKLIRQGCGEGTLVLSRSQSKGRGRLGREWVSPYGLGLYASMVLKPPFIHPRISVIVGLGMVECLLREGIGNARVKWPNDSMIEKKKVGGILTEVFEEYVIVGIGVNVFYQPEVFPEGLRDQVTALDRHLKDRPNMPEICGNILGSMVDCYLSTLPNMDVPVDRVNPILFRSFPVIVDGVICDVTGVMPDGRLKVRTREGKEIITQEVEYVTDR